VSGARAQRGRSPFAVGLVVLVLLGVAVYFGFTKSNPFGDPFELRAGFRTVNGLRVSSPVRIAGVNVGKVTAIEPLGGGSQGAVVTMSIDDRGLPLHRDAQAKVRPRIFLEGNWFVDLQPGSPSAPVLADREVLPVQQTSAPVQFGDLLTTLQTDTRTDLRRVLQLYGRAIDSKGGDGYNRSIPWWEPAFRDSAVVSDATRGIAEHDLSEYLAGAAKVAAGIDRDPARLKELITSFAATADAFADEEANLSAAIHQLPLTLDQGYRTLGVLRDAFPPLRRFVADMRPTVRSAGPALRAQLPFVKELRGLVSRPELRGMLDDLRPLVPQLVELNRGGIAFQEQQRQLASCQTNVAVPWANDSIEDPNFDSAGKVYEEGAKQFVGLAAESRNFDANGQYVRSYAQNANYAYLLGDRFFLTALPVEGINPPKAPGFPAYKPKVPCETQERPDLRTIPGAAPAGVRIDQNAPGAAQRRARARAVALDWMREQLDSSGLGKSLTLSDEPLRADELDDVRRTLGDEAAP
jgi:ABC-type transporter Mla subunit MlaD